MCVESNPQNGNWIWYQNDVILKDCLPLNLDMQEPVERLANIMSVMSGNAAVSFSSLPH